MPGAYVALALAVCTGGGQGAVAAKAHAVPVAGSNGRNVPPGAYIAAAVLVLEGTPIEIKDSEPNDTMLNKRFSGLGILSLLLGSAVITLSPTALKPNLSSVILGRLNADGSASFLAGVGAALLSALLIFRKHSANSYKRKSS